MATHTTFFVTYPTTVNAKTTQLKTAVVLNLADHKQRTTLLAFVTRKMQKNSLRKKTERDYAVADAGCNTGCGTQEKYVYFNYEQ